MSSNAVVSALLAAALGSGCATVVKGGRNELIFHSAPDDLKAYALGEELALSRSGTSDGKARFKASVPKEAHELKLRTEGLDLPVALHSHVGVGWVVADLVLTGLIGLVVDGITSRWLELDDVDVARALSTARAAGSAVPARDTGPARTHPRQEPLLSRSLPPPSREGPPAQEQVRRAGGGAEVARGVRRRERRVPSFPCRTGRAAESRSRDASAPPPARPP